MADRLAKIGLGIEDGHGRDLMLPKECGSQDLSDEGRRAMLYSEDASGPTTSREHRSKRGVARSAEDRPFLKVIHRFLRSIILAQGSG
ncbi:hypothetical protein QQ045_009435 [Rhodiola kirilowii]